MDDPRMFHPHHSQTYPIPAYGRPAHKSTLPALPISLSVSTSSISEHDPNESTARPSNAHKHAQFLSGALTSFNRPGDPPDSVLFTEDPAGFTAEDPVSTPVVGHPPIATSAAGLPTPLNSADSQRGVSHEFSLSNTPGISRGLTRSLTPAEQEKLAHLDRLKFFLATAPSQWDGARSSQNFAPTHSQNSYPSTSGLPPSNVGSSTGWGMGLPPVNGPPGATTDAYAQGMHPSLNRFMLPSQEFVTCVLWNGLYHITGTDIVRALVFRFEAFGRPVRNMKKFEEGIFSDLRNLKPGVDACLEEPKSPFLDLLFKYQCIRTQKKQKVFYWFSVPHDRLFLDALERDLKREKMGLEATTQIVGEPALSFTYDPKRSLYEQFAKAQGLKEGEGELEGVVRRAEQDNLGGDGMAPSGSESDAELIESTGGLDIGTEDSEMSDADDMLNLSDGERERRNRIKQEQRKKRHLQKVNGGAAFFSNIFGLFEGSPTYKQRRKKNSAAGSSLSRSVSNSSSVSYRRGSEDFDERGRQRSIGAYGTGLERHHSQSSISRERSYPYPQPYSHTNRAFQYPSMMDEFGPNSLDAKEREELNAAQLFQKQARGELVPGDGIIRKPKAPHIMPPVDVMISEGFTAHPQQFPGSDQQQQQQLDNAFSNGFDTGMFGSQSANSTDPNGTQYETADGKFRAFMCPLYSCGRLFKRMEHLKRHMRTHTMERPYACNICQKRFSRSDNLNQHLRTHERTVGQAGSGLSGGAGGLNYNPLGGIGGGIGGDHNAMDMSGMSGMGGLGHVDSMMWRENGNNEESDFSGTESELEDYMYTTAQQSMMGGGMGVDNGMGGMMMMNQGGVGGIGVGDVGGTNGFNMQMCEIEVQANDVREVPGGEEEGMLLRTGASLPLPLPPHQYDIHLSHLQQQQRMYVPPRIMQTNSNGSEFGDSNAQWATARPSPPPTSLAQIRSSNSNRPSFSGTSSPGYMRTHTPSSSTSSTSIYNGNSNDTPSTSTSTTGAAGGTNDYVTSLSAPSHKQSFDHTSLYPHPPSALLDNVVGLGSIGGGGSVSATGPIRRHRSMTPSLIKNGDSIRRPMTASSQNSEFGAMSISHSISGSPGLGSGSLSSSVSSLNSGLSMGLGNGGMGNGRGYHPYAAAAGYNTTNSRSGSTHSSPAIYSVPLASGTSTGSNGSDENLKQNQDHQIRRSESRSSFVGGLHDMLQQQQQGAGETNMFRTDSPSFHQQTESPAPYTTMDLPPLMNHHQHHQHLFGQQQEQEMDGSYFGTQS